MLRCPKVVSKVGFQQESKCQGSPHDNLASGAGTEPAYLQNTLTGLLSIKGMLARGQSFI
jgi:hypothetical protein